MVAFWMIGCLAVGVLYWIYDGYGRFLQLLAAIRRPRTAPQANEVSEGAWPEITVLLTVHNEERVIRQKLENLLACEYPGGRSR